MVTGNSRGLGQALSHELLQRGHRVAGCSRSRGVDVSDFAQVSAWAATVGVPDVLINNAAVTTRPDPIWQQDPAEFQRALQVNVAGVQHVLRAFLPAMIERGSGIVVNVSSDWGRGAAPLVGPYCASKAAVEMLTACLAQELPPGMAAVTLDPGTWDTDMLRFTFGEGAAEYPQAHLFASPCADLLLSLGPEHNGQKLTL